MSKFFFLPFLIFLTNTSAFATPIVSSYFRPVPLTEAHVTYGYSSEKELNPESIKALIWNIKKTVLWGESKGSDHKPMTVEFKIGKRSSR